MFLNGKKVLVSYVMAATVTANLPCLAVDVTTDTSPVSTINAFLAGIAGKNGLVSTHAGAQPSAGSASAPTWSQAVAAINSLPAVVHYSTATHTPDPTAEEMQFVLPDQHELMDDKSGMLFSNIALPTDETMNGFFEELRETETTDGEDMEGMGDLSRPSEEIMEETFSPSNDLLESVLTPHEPVLTADAGGDLAGSIEVVERDNILVLEQTSATHPGQSSTSARGLALLDIPIGALSVPFGIVDSASDNASQPSAPLGAILLQGFVSSTEKKNAETLIVSEPGAVFEDSNNNVDVIAGAVMIDARSKSQVTVPGALITVKKGALLAVDVEGNCARIRACSGPGHITVVSEGREIRLNPGEELVVVNGEMSQVDAFPADGIGRRKIHKHELSAQKSVAISEFSMTTLLAKHAWMSRGNAQLVSKMLKTAVALQIATRGHGRYYAADSKKMPSKAFVAWN